MVETPDQTAVATMVPPGVVPVPPMPLPPEPPAAQPAGPSPERAHLDTLQELLKLQQQAMQTALDQIEEIKKQLAAPPVPAEPETDRSAQTAPPEPETEQPVGTVPPEPETAQPVEKVPDVVLSVTPAPAFEYRPAPPEEPPEISPKYTGLVAAVITLAVALTIIVCWAIFWASSGHPLPWVEHPQVVVPPATSLPAAVHETYPDPPSTAFAVAVAGLNDAFARFPGVSPNDILWEASRRDSSCLLQWNDGYPSFLFGSGSPHPSSLALTIGQCADAVRHLPPPKARP